MMLHTLDYWRAQCSEEQLAEFDHRLRLHCGTAVISQTNLKNRYHDSYHQALINNKVLLAGIKTHDYIRGSALWGSKFDAGKEFATILADHDGCLPVKNTNSEYKKSIALLLQRGILFEQDGFYHLPAEMVIELRGKEKQNSWLTLVAKIPLAMLYQLVPDDAQNNMLKPKAIRNELGAWLAIKGEQAQQTDISADLDESDWILLLTLQHHNIEDFDELERLYPELETVHVTAYYGYRDSVTVSLRKSLETNIPKQLQKLCLLGLIGIAVRHGDERYASIHLCDEAEKILKPHLKKARQRIANQLQEQWKAPECDIQQPSPWSMDQYIWRLWITLHFLPLGITQQGKLRKNDLKKIAAALKDDDVSRIECMVFSMLRSKFLEQENNILVSLPIHWLTWRKALRANIIEIIRNWDSWGEQDEKQALGLLSKLPINCWLKLDEVVEWLQMQSSGHVTSADWMPLFMQNQNSALHHLNTSQRSIYLLPEFRAVLQNKPITFKAPGWHGADKKAKVHGFISAAGEIQLPPDCNHKVLDQLATFCNITAIEQMITLQLDDKAIQRMGTDKAALKKIRRLLESLQSPLPQAIAYLFDKQQSQKPVAQVAATAMVILLHDVSAIHKLQKTGFEFSQPFKDRPEIVLLDASSDALAFINSCNEAGILLKTLIKPVQWISGTAAVNAWMDINIDREDQWLEISYQKTRSSKPKQFIARIDADYYGAIRIQGTRKVKQGYALLKSTVQLQPKHVLRMRELDDLEVTELGLDRLESSST